MERIGSHFQVKKSTKYRKVTVQMADIIWIYKSIINGTITYQSSNRCLSGWVMLHFFLLHIYENNFDKKIYYKHISKHTWKFAFELNDINNLMWKIHISIFFFEGVILRSFFQKFIKIRIENMKIMIETPIVPGTED